MMRYVLGKKVVSIMMKRSNKQGKIYRRNEIR